MSNIDIIKNHMLKYWKTPVEGDSEVKTALADVGIKGSPSLLAGNYAQYGSMEKSNALSSFENYGIINTKELSSEQVFEGDTSLKITASLFNSGIQKELSGINTQVGSWYHFAARVYLTDSVSDKLYLYLFGDYGSLLKYTSTATKDKWVLLEFVTQRVDTQNWKLVIECGMSTNATFYIDQLRVNEINNENLVIDGSIETDISRWNAVGSYTIAHSDEQARSGTKSLKASVYSSWAGAGYAFQFKKGRRYRLNCWVYIDYINGSEPKGVYIKVKKNDGTNVGYGVPDTLGMTSIVGEWVYLSADYYEDTDGTSGEFSVISYTGTTSSIFYIDDVYIKEVRDNLILNGDFTDGDNGMWFVTHPVNSEITFDNAYSQSGTKLGVRFTADGDYQNIVNNTAPIKYNSWYKLRITYKVIRRGNTAQYCLFDVDDSDRSCVISLSPTIGAWVTDEKIFKQVHGFGANAAGANLKFYPSNGGSGGDYEIWIDSCELVELTPVEAKSLTELVHYNLDFKNNHLDEPTKAIKFTGDTYKSSFIKIPHENKYNIENLKAISFWLDTSQYQDVGSVWNMLFFKGDPQTAIGWGIAINGWAIRLGIGDCWYDEGNAPFGDIAYQSGWHHWVFQPILNDWRVYLDGTVRAQNTNNLVEYDFGNNTNDLLIGKEKEIRGLTGKLEDIKFFNRKLSSSDVVKLYLGV